MSIVTVPIEQSRMQASSNPAMMLALTNASRPRPRRGPKRKPAQSKKQSPNSRRGQKKQPKLSLIAKNLIKNPHPCIMQYISALVDPRNTPQGACIPWGFPVPTQRVKVSFRGTFNLGTTGKGFAYMALAVASDVAAVITTTSSSVGTNATNLNAFTLCTNNFATKLPYVAGNIVANGIGARFVAGGIRIRYAGTEANRNGIVTVYEGQANTPAANSYAVWGGDPNARNERPDPNGSWHSCYYSGPTQSTQTNLGTSVFWGGFAPIVCYVQGVAGDLYEFEYYAHMEYSGDIVPGMEMSHSEPEAYAKVLQATKKVTTSEPITDNNSKSVFTEFLKEGGTTIWNWIKEYGMTTAMASVSNYLLPGSGTAMKMLTYK